MVWRWTYCRLEHARVYSADCTLMHDGVMGEGWERVGDGDGWERGDKCRDSRVSAGGGGGQ